MNRRDERNGAATVIPSEEPASSLPEWFVSLTGGREENEETEGEDTPETREISQQTSHYASTYRVVFENVRFRVQPGFNMGSTGVQQGFNRGSSVILCHFDNFRDIFVKPLCT